MTLQVVPVTELTDRLDGSLDSGKSGTADETYSGAGVASIAARKTGSIIAEFVLRFSRAF